MIRKSLRGANEMSDEAIPRLSLTPMSIGVLAMTIGVTFLYSQSISIDKKVIDFGTVKEKAVFTGELEIKNPSNKILSVGIRSSCVCIFVAPERVNLKQNQKIKIKIKVDTTGYNGNFNEKIFFQSNDPKNPYITIQVKGYILSKEKVTIPITVFDSAGCLFCIELRKNIIPAYQKKYAIKIELFEYSVDEPKNYSALVFLEKKSQKTLNKIPVIFIGDDLVGGKEEIKKQLPLLLEKYKKLGFCKKIEIPIEKIPETKPIEKLKILPVVFAGLIDSINPCAFATIIFLITYLSMILKKQKSEVLLTGICFIVGVFITYFLIGLGLFKFIQKISGIGIISKIMYFLIGGFAIFISYQNLRDAITIKKGIGIGDSSIKTKLPNVLRWKIYDVITKFTTFKYLLPVAFLIGSIITVLELFCTGQIYLPTIIYIIGLPEYRMSGIFYLLLYCFLFVLPLIFIFSLFYFGLNIDRLEAVFRQKIFIVKLLAAALLLTLGIIIFKIVFFT
ncbi:MAG: DUF1573 domain-containing protein [Elusimicrobia bacterium]|nr:DUF1573 domain-containing protein [Elusimicrobiota bacterium]